MRFSNSLLPSVLLLVIMGSCQKDQVMQEQVVDQQLDDALSAHGGRTEFILPKATDLSAIPADPLSPLTKEKVKLGKMLFHETGLGVNPMKGFSATTFSCASCHLASAGFQAGRFQ